jgi:hypothetical protein
MKCARIELSNHVNHVRALPNPNRRWPWALCFDGQCNHREKHGTDHSAGVPDASRSPGRGATPPGGASARACHLTEYAGRNSQERKLLRQFEASLMVVGPQKEHAT